ncbi:MAG: fatty acid desaturase family protein [Boseongicola sp.]
MSAKLLRKKHMRSFVGLQKYERHTAWFIVFGYLSQIVISVALGSYLLGLSTSPITVLASFVLIVFIGTRLRGLNNIVHECSHSTFSTDRSDNVLIGKICASLLFGSFSEYRDEHLSHHAHVGDYEHDLDLQGIQNLRIHDPLTRGVILRHLINPFLGRHLPYYLGLNMSTRDGRAFLALKIALLFAVGVFTAFFPMTGSLFVIVPLVFAYSTLNYWADCMDHAGIVPADDELDSSRNILAPRFIRWLLFPRNDCFHLVHHLFPNVPARHLATTHEALIDDRLYRSRPNAVRAPVGLDGPLKDAAVPAE